MVLDGEKAHSSMYAWSQRRSDQHVPSHGCERSDEVNMARSRRTLRREEVLVDSGVVKMRREEEW